MSTNVKPPTTELGQTNGTVYGVQSWTSFHDADEKATELTWPTSIATYDQMRTDAQVEALLFGTFMPIRRYRWMIDPNGARAEVVNGVADDLGLPIMGRAARNRPRSKRRFSHGRHLYHALLALAYGHAYFEQVGEVRDGLWHLRKLAPRMPKTISEIRVERDGGLRSIVQNLAYPPVEIPVDRLVAYIWEQEGANWLGRSMLRSIYKHWLLKDRLMRIDAVKHQRNGMGLPFATAPPGATPTQVQELQRLASSTRANDFAGAVLPSGSDIRLRGVEGSIPDTLASIRYHDEQMARRFMMMFAQLGQTETGSRALGDSFVDFFGIAQQGIAEWYCGVTNEHVIEDWVDWNYGEDEAAPLLTYEVAEDPSLSIADLALLVEKGLLTVDDELEAWLRESHRLPDKAPEDDPPPPPTQIVVPADVTVENGTPGTPSDESAPPAGTIMPSNASRRVSRVQAQGNPAYMPRNPRRQMYEQEVMAQTDYGYMEARLDSAVGNLVGQWSVVRDQQIEELVEQIIAADGDVVKLARIQATPVGKELLENELLSVLEDGARAARDEAFRQGVQYSMPKLDAAQKATRAQAQALDEVLARSLSDAASRNALRRAGGSLTPEEVAAEVRQSLMELSDRYLDDQFNGATNQAFNHGRREAMRQSGKGAQYYASELMDANTCQRCIERDGANYSDLTAAEADYPAGGYKDCLGGPRCRGTLVAVYEEADD